MNLVKVPFLLINLLFLVFALFLVALGVFILTDATILDKLIAFPNVTEIQKLSKQNVLKERGRADHDGDGSRNETGSAEDVFLYTVRDPISYLFIALGASIFSLSFIGYCGAMRDSRLLLAAFGFALTLLVFLEAVGVTLYFTILKPDVKSYLKERVESHYNPDPVYLDPTDPRTTFTVFFDFFMIYNDCCGITGPQDFSQNYRNHKIFRETAPKACCPMDKTFPHFDAEVRHVYMDIILGRPTGNRAGLEKYVKSKEECERITGPEPHFLSSGEDLGCYDKVQTDWAKVLILAGVVLGLLQLAGIVFTIFVFRAAYYDYHG